ncbi:MAG TPA: bifunctional (p)ppGpp synthetase/guanosine-3',5'-bis(diphosphate) 3'-pyrophosphohydrolase [Pseudogracilibacillus sp.]|nr:bifunctional (p)ppGpp synthetase/guanosine-3',5'-bis(diphosphate) 3'-pyrophosphohydrolase [Pseudogracilibacillus sp.]
MSKDKNVTIDEIIEKVKEYMTTEDVDFVYRAYEFARDAHEGQFRKSGEPYIIHPVQVANILVDLEMDAETIAGGFLHDVVEDTEVTLEELAEAFNEEVAMLVDGVTKLDKLKYKSSKNLQAETHRKMFVAMAKDIRVILIKIADRLHNMRTLKHLPPDKQQRISYETLEIFSPLTHRLGMSTIKWELEDIAFRYLKPQEYYRVVQLMNQKRDHREQYIAEVMQVIEEELEKVNIEAEISGRPKHIYSTWRKMQIQNIEFNEIYDLLAVRVIVNSIKDCYAVLGIIHTFWKPMPGRFKDYIAMPKPNLYQSLHTTVIGPKGDPLEVQIRTKDMHRTAEYGIAAHWAYKEGKRANSKQSFEEKLTWFREILEWQNEAHDAEEFVESLKVDLFSHMVYVFTPKGEVIELPNGSIPIDFAYRIHTEIGNKTVGARINGKMEPLDYKLKNGDIVEIVTSRHSYGPSQDWLNITASSQAKNKIKQYFKKQKREENVDKGKELVLQSIKEYGFDSKDVLTDNNIKRVLDKFNFTNIEDMYASVGYGGITSSLIVTRLTDKLRREKETGKNLEEKIEQLKSTVREPSIVANKNDVGVEVEGIDNVLIRLARCCNPVPNDDIIGYITKGRGITVHRTDCLNIQSDDAKERFLTVHWKRHVNNLKEYNVDLEVSGYDRHGLLNDVLQIVNETNTQIASVTGRADKHKIAHIHLTIMIKNTDHLKHVVDKIKQVKDIYAVTRTVH